jgi:hypothetical protein
MGCAGCPPAKPQVLEAILKLLQDAPWGGIYIAAPALDLLQATLGAARDRQSLPGSLGTRKDIFERLILKLLSSCGTAVVMLSSTLLCTAGRSHPYRP